MSSYLRISQVKFCGRPFKNLKLYDLLKQNISIQIFWRLSLTNFTWSILKFLNPMWPTWITITHLRSYEHKLYYRNQKFCRKLRRKSFATFLKPQWYIQHICRKRQRKQLKGSNYTFVPQDIRISLYRISLIYCSNAYTKTNKKPSREGDSKC